MIPPAMSRQSTIRFQTGWTSKDFRAAAAAGQKRVWEIFLGSRGLGGGLKGRQCSCSCGKFIFQSFGLTFSILRCPNICLQIFMLGMDKLVVEEDILSSRWKKTDDFLLFKEASQYNLHDVIFE